MIATRIFVIMSARSQYWNQACQAPGSIGKIALDNLRDQDLLSVDTLPKFLAEEKFTTRTHLILDICHDTYRPEDGHLPGQDELPVLHLRLSKEEGVESASMNIQRAVNERVREIHDLTGEGSVPPFLIDHLNGQIPTFWHPRLMQKASKPAQDGETSKGVGNAEASGSGS